MRHCYMCGRPSSRRTVVEPLLVPVCLVRECGRAAAQLPVVHCAVRSPDGRLCGAPTTALMDREGQRVCPAHLKTRWAAA
jgi:hypothetical protein